MYDIEKIEIKKSEIIDMFSDSAPLYIVIVDKDGNIKYMNSPCEEVVKAIHHSPIENINNLLDIFDISSEETELNLEQMNTNFAELKLTNLSTEMIDYKKYVNNQLISITPKGLNKKMYVGLYIAPTNKDGKFNGSVITIKNLNNEYVQRKKLLKERTQFLNLSTELKAKCDIIEVLRKREQEHLVYLKNVINNISEGIMVFDNNGKLSLCNKAVYSILQFQNYELLNDKNLLQRYEIYDLYFCKSVDNLYADYFSNGTTIKNKILRFKDKQNGEIKYIELNSNHSVNRNTTFDNSIITLKDVTETKLHEINFEEQARFIEDVVNTVDVPIAVVDYPEYKYKLVNEKYKEIVKYMHNNSNEYLAGLDSDISRFLSEERKNSVINVLEKLSEEKAEHTFSHFTVKDSNDKERHIKAKVKLYENVDKTKRFHIHGIDVTEEVNHNMELEKITKLKDEFFTVISHELRTPITIMSSSLQLAYDVFKDDITPNIDKTLSRISQNCTRLLKLTNNILDISKAEAGFLSLNNEAFDIVELSEMITRSVNYYAISRGIDLIFDTNEEECGVVLDKEKYEKILLNLLSNAIKFTPNDRKIIVEINVNDQYFELSVADEGIGIPKDKIDYIFDRFAQVNSSLSRCAEGTGIGLALVKKLVELMYGTITVVSEEQKGTKFIVRFPTCFSALDSKINYAMISDNIKHKINLEFSDIN